MESLKNVLADNNIRISLRHFGSKDLKTAYEINVILDNYEMFYNLSSRPPLTEITNLDEYYLYLLLLKLADLNHIVSEMSLDEQSKERILTLSKYANETASSVNMGVIVKFLNLNVQDIFDKGKTASDMRFVTLDIMAELSNGIAKSTFEFLCKNHGYLLVDKFDMFEKTFEKYTDLFEMLYPLERIGQIDCFQIQETFEIWEHILSKKNTKLKCIVEQRVNALAEYVKKLSNEATIENVLQVEQQVRRVHLFLQRTHNPKANEFAEYAKATADLLAQYLQKCGQRFQYEIPTGEIMQKWRETEPWYIRLLCLTHKCEHANGTVAYVSQLSKGPETKHSITDFLQTNIPTDDYFTWNHQNWLLITEAVGTGNMMAIVQNNELLTDYINIVLSATNFISEHLQLETERLQNDIAMLTVVIQLFMSGSAINDNIARGVCYGATMLMCALIEKVIRLLYVHLAKEEKYIPTDKVTLGDLLTATNTYIVKVFGENHVKNLSFFLQKSATSGVGQNIRNSLAHWANILPEEMTKYFLAKMLWIFTDVLNTVFGYCLENKSEENKHNDQL